MEGVATPVAIVALVLVALVALRVGLVWMLIRLVLSLARNPVIFIVAGVALAVYFGRD